MSQNESSSAHLGVNAIKRVWLCRGKTRCIRVHGHRDEWRETRQLHTAAGSMDIWVLHTG